MERHELHLTPRLSSSVLNIAMDSDFQNLVRDALTGSNEVGSSQGRAVGPGRVNAPKHSTPGSPDVLTPVSPLPFENAWA